jgi:pimeloyl-ACP methyl ester carboxylesterase
VSIEHQQTAPRRRVDRRTAARLLALRAGFAAAERVAPALGARWAFRLWVKLPDVGARRRDQRPEPGRRSTVALAGDRTIAVESWGEGPPVYLVHGWGGWRGQMGAFIAPLVDSGFRAVAYDAPSHGDSGPGHLGPGKSSMLEMSEALAGVTAANGAPAAVIAHSGGAMATSAAIRDGLAVPRLVMVAASADPLLLIDRLASVIGFGPRIRRRVKSYTTRLAGRPLADYDVRRLGAFAAHPPALVIHDRDDREVPVSDGEQIAAAWQDAELRLTAGLGHRRILRNPEVVAAAVRFVGSAH